MENQGIKDKLKFRCHLIKIYSPTLRISPYKDLNKNPFKETTGITDQTTETISLRQLITSVGVNKLARPNIGIMTSPTGKVLARISGRGFRIINNRINMIIGIKVGILIGQTKLISISHRKRRLREIKRIMILIDKMIIMNNKLGIMIDRELFKTRKMIIIKGKTTMTPTIKIRAVKEVDIKMTTTTIMVKKIIDTATTNKAINNMDLIN